MNIFSEENPNDLTEEEIKEAVNFIMYLKNKRPQIVKPENNEEIIDENLKTNVVIEKLLKKVEDLSALSGQITKLKVDLVEKNETIKFWQNKYFELDSNYKLIQKESTELKVHNNSLIEENNRLNQRIDNKILNLLLKK